MINDALKIASNELLEQYDKIQGFSFITPHTAKIEFIKFCYYGNEYHRYNSLAFHKNQFKTKGDIYSTYEGLQLVNNGDINPERLRFATSERIKSIISGSLAFAGAKMPLDFPAQLAKVLIDEFCEENGRVLDPCSGWGGRLIGFLASKAKTYEGVDASPDQVENDMQIYETFKDVCKTPKECKITCSPFEKYEVKENTCDFALTSPPYFDTEHYIGGEQSHATNENYMQWRENFYAILIKQVYKALKKECIFCLQVGSQRYPLLEDGKAIATECGFKIKEIRATDMINNFNKTDKIRGECILILQK